MQPPETDYIFEISIEKYVKRRNNNWRPKALVVYPTIAKTFP